MADPLTTPPRRSLTVERAPHWRAADSARTVYWTTLYAAALPVLAGLALFGWQAGRVLALSAASVMLTEWLFVGLAHRPSLARHGGRAHTLLMGVLLGMTLPATADWLVVVLAGIITVVVGKGLMGGMGHYLWHPVLIGRFVVQVLFFSQLGAATGPVLDRFHLFLGRVGSAVAGPAYGSWLSASAPVGADGFIVSEPMSVLSELAYGKAPWIRQTIEQVTTGGELGSPAGAVLFKLLWERLGDLSDLLLGAAPGGLGATCGLAILIGGLLLIYHGYLRWQLVVSFLLAAGLTAAAAPLRIGGADPGSPAWHWLPGLQFHGAMPVGPIYVGYHLLSGELLLGAFFFAGEMVSRPITTRGQILFGLGCGLLTILIRLYLFAPGAVFLAILLMNTLTPLIDRITQPRAFGH